MFTRVYETVGGCWGAPVYPVSGDIREKRPPASRLLVCSAVGLLASCGGDGSAFPVGRPPALPPVLIWLQHDKRTSFLDYSFSVMVYIFPFIGLFNKFLSFQ